ncbi:MAG TPA: hypothetical protein VFQ54_13205, partial [Thermomicrobiales bacterium]|nr:hypothetical protein [Thermomicrobiales bacterium]
AQPRKPREPRPQRQAASAEPAFENEDLSAMALAFAMAGGEDLLTDEPEAAPKRAPRREKSEEEDKDQ